MMILHVRYSRPPFHNARDFLDPGPDAVGI